MNSRPTIYPTITKATDDSEVIRMWVSLKRQQTQQGYLRTIRQFLQFVDKPLVEVKLEDLIQWIESLLLRNHTQNTIRTKVSIVKSLFSFAWKIGYLAVDVAKLVKPPMGVEAIHERILEADEVKKLIAATQMERDRVVLSLIYTTGLRVSEALSINWQDLKPLETGGQVTVEGKGGKLRTVLLSQSLWQQIQSLPRNPKADAIFSTKFWNRLDRHQLHRNVKRAAEKAGINPHVSIHWLRHAHACHALKAGCDLDVLMRSLGHSSLTVTSKYLHVRPTEGSSQFIDL